MNILKHDREVKQPSNSKRLVAIPKHKIILREIDTPNLVLKRTKDTLNKILRKKIMAGLA